MGVLTDFVVAHREEAQEVCDSPNPSQDFGGLEAKGIDSVKLGVLHALLVGGEFDPSFMLENDCCTGGEEGPWVFEVPDDLIRRLAALDEAQLESIGEKWAATEEFSPEYESWPIEAVQQVLRDFTALGRRAIDERKSVLMWVCL